MLMEDQNTAKCLSKSSRHHDLDMHLWKTEHQRILSSCTFLQALLWQACKSLQFMAMLEIGHAIVSSTDPT